MCSQIRAIGDLSWDKARVGADERSSKVDERVRRCHITFLPWAYERMLCGVFRLLAYRFSILTSSEIDGIERPVLLKYQRGDVFKPHRDCSNRHNAAEWARHRLLTLVLAVSVQGEDYNGGDLVLYSDADGSRVPVPLAPGDLCLFHADTLHSVTPITAGTRLSVVSWYHGRCVYPT
jgi:Rps23 Pro-64 3,4-dihydroxylase Tpa1-like proline 4-hydroxylase